MGKKHDLPAMPFYWGDWFKAMDVQTLPRDIRCVWFEMLGRMWESTERGVLSVGGRPMNSHELAMLLGFGSDVDSVNRIANRLLEVGVCSKREDGALYSRRIVKEEKIRKINKENGAKGGNPAFSVGNSVNRNPNRCTEDEREYENEIDYEFFFKAWNDFAEIRKLAKLRELSKSRKSKIKARNINIDMFTEILTKAGESEFLMGATGWKLTFDWIFENDKNFNKILEGNYANGKRINTGTGRFVGNFERGSEDKYRGL